MRIRNLIKVLQDIEDTHGNLNVTMYDWEWGALVHIKNTTVYRNSVVFNKVNVAPENVLNDSNKR